MTWSTEKKAVLLILGMHRSGTSAMAGVCRLMGIDFGDHLAPALTDNPKGFFEDLRITETQEKLLNALGLTWDYPGMLPAGWERAAAALEYRERLKEIAQSLAAPGSLWGFKDPRLSRLFPLWRGIFDELGAAPKCVLTLRHPLEIAASLRARNGLSTEQSLWLWLIYTLEAERHTRGLPRVFVRYEDLLAQPEPCLARVAGELGIAWVREYAEAQPRIAEFLEPSLRHHQSPATDLAGAVPASFFEEVAHATWAAANGEPLDPAALDDVYRSLDTLLLPVSLGHKLRESQKFYKALEDKQAELLRTTDWATELKAHMDQFVAQRTELMKLSAWATELKSHLATAERDNKRLQANYAQQHQKLMEISDWAHGMNQRLQTIERSFVMRPAKLLMELELRARDAVNRFLAAPLFDPWLRPDSRPAPTIQHFAPIRDRVAEKDGRLVVVFPIINWEFRWQRPQQIVSRLPARGYSVLYLAMGLFSKGVAYSSLQHAATDVGFNELAEHVTQVWLYTKGSLNLYKDALSGHDLDNLVLGMSAVLDMAQPRDIVFLVQFPGWAPLALRLRERFGGRLVFDCMDDHGGFSTNTRSAIKAEEELIERSDLVITSSHLLMEKARAFNENTLLVMNGTEFEHFHQPLPNGELDHLRGHPIIGYYGAISDWFDLDLVIYCARERPTWFFLLIGEIHGCDVSATQQLPNVLFLGEKPYRELPGYLAYFDVCTIPFKIMPLTLATNPVKFYEYLSSGKPVVAVDLPELLPYQNDCYIALNREEFLAKLEQALQTKDRKDLQARRIALAKENSWDARVADILSHPVFASA